MSLMQLDNSIKVLNVGVSSGGAASMAPALAATAGKTNYLEGFEITGSGATGASVIEASITGLEGGTIYFELPIVAGVNLAAFPLMGPVYSVRFPQPIPASGVDVAITLNVPSFGSGNTNSSANLYGFQK
jgi:hypothetical protein